MTLRPLLATLALLVIAPLARAAGASLELPLLFYVGMLLALITGCLGVQEARASSDDSCYPSWNLKRDTLEIVSKL